MIGAQETSGGSRTSFQGSGLGTFRRPPAKVSKAWMTAKVCQVGWNRHWTPVRVSREFWARPNAVAQRINICHVEDVAASSYGIQGLETHVQAWKLGSSLAQATLGRYSQGESTQVDAGHWADPDLRFCACTTSVGSGTEGSKHLRNIAHSLPHSSVSNSFGICLTNPGT